jgi:hypothetical protein
MGSRHTHACAWNGNNTAIDNCGPTAGYAYEGSCSGAPTPSNGGTIMSYCHLVGSVGINFSNGFGPQPKAAILAKYNAGTCLTACTGSSCNAPTGMSTTSITTSSATFNWTAVSGAASYNVRYRVVSNLTWTNSSTASASFNVAGLSSATNYEWQVQTVCSGGSSAFTASTLFTTLTSVCTDVYEPNNSKNSAAIIPVATNISALINPTGEYDWFTFSNTSAQRNIRVTLTNLPANYDVRLYGSNGNYVAISQNSGLTSETINYNTNTVGTWRIRVNGFNGAFNASQCYTLRAEISGTPFSAPQEMVSGENVSQQQSQLTLFPNPAHNNLTVNFYSETDGKAVFNLYALPGEKVMSLENNVQEGMNSFELNTSSLTNGIYIFEMLSEGNAIRQKLIVSK